MLGLVTFGQLAPPKCENPSTVTDIRIAVADLAIYESKPLKSG